MKTTGIMLRAGVLAALLGMGGAAQAEEMKVETVNWLMLNAFTQMPDKFTTAEQKVIVVDRSKPDEFFVPVEEARQIIKVAWNSARAQVCKMLDKQQENYEALIKREEASKKWSDKQMLFIKQLHLFVVQFSTGIVKITAEGDTKKVETLETSDKLKKVRPCTPEEAAQLKDEITAYVKGSS